MWLDAEQRGRVERVEVPESPKRLDFGVDLDGWMGRSSGEEGEGKAEDERGAGDATAQEVAEARMDDADVADLPGSTEVGDHALVETVAGSTSPLTDIDDPPSRPATSVPELEPNLAPEDFSPSPPSTSNPLESPAYSPAGSPANSADSV
jgi:hypothetical protein